MKVSIYRVETPRGGCGPYTAEFEEVLGDMFTEHGECRQHPGPAQDDMLGWIDPAEHCGFATREQIYTWVDGWLPLLAETGFVGVRYVMPITLVRYGKLQAVFRRGDNWPVEQFSLV